ncbi:MAG: polysaccharide deacetylase family protein [Nitrososphaerales archaeon]
MIGVFSDKFVTSFKRFTTIIEKYDAHCTFPIVASVMVRHKRIVQNIIDGGHEIASHGFIHVRFDYLSYDEQLRMLRHSIKVLEEIVGRKIIGLRTPYQLYNKNTFNAIVDAGFKYDSSIFSPKPKPPYLMIVKTRRLIEIPWMLSEVTLVDVQNVSPSELLRIWIRVLKECEIGDVVTLDAHPVRMGTERYIEVMDKILHYARNNGFRIASLGEVYEMFLRKKISMPVLALSGDIDCVSLTDYFLRLRKKA